MMSDLLMTYLQNNINSIIEHPIYGVTEGVAEISDSYEIAPVIESIIPTPSAVYPILYSVESASAKFAQSLSDLEDNFTQLYKSCLIRMLMSTEFVDGESNEVYWLFDKMLEESQRMSLLTLQELYWERAKHNDVKTLTKLLNLLAYCPFNVAGDVGMCLFVTALQNKDVRVQSMALRVAAHWACPQLLSYIDTMDFSKYPWLEMKVENIKRSVYRK